MTTLTVPGTTDCLQYMSSPGSLREILLIFRDRKQKFSWKIIAHESKQLTYSSVTLIFPWNQLYSISTPDIMATMTITGKFVSNSVYSWFESLHQFAPKHMTSNTGQNKTAHWVFLWKSWQLDNCLQIWFTHTLQYLFDLIISSCFNPWFEYSTAVE